MTWLGTLAEKTLTGKNLNVGVYGDCLLVIGDCGVVKNAIEALGLQLSKDALQERGKAVEVITSDPQSLHKVGMVLRGANDQCALLLDTGA
jgi:TusA-related sulfurtransferase